MKTDDADVNGIHILFLREGALQVVTALKSDEVHVIWLRVDERVDSRVGTVDSPDAYFLLLCTILHYSIPGHVYRIAHMATPAPRCIVAMRSESRAAPRAIATVIFSFCFFVMPVLVCRTADRHTRAQYCSIASEVYEYCTHDASFLRSLNFS